MLLKITDLMGWMSEGGRIRTSLHLWSFTCIRIVKNKLPDTFSAVILMHHWLYQLNQCEVVTLCR